ncbi:hypothetical protein OAA39_00805 [bacterium]|nr:hypothetical protein [bacterium]
MGLHWQFGVVQGASGDTTYSLAPIQTAITGAVGSSVRIRADTHGTDPKVELMTSPTQMFLMTEPGSGEVLRSYAFNDSDLPNFGSEDDELSLNGHNPRGSCFANNGSFLYVVGLASPFLKRYALSTPYDFASVTATTTANTSSFASPQGIAFKTDGSVMFLPESNNADVKVVGLSTNYDITSTFSTSTVSLAVTDDDGDTITALFGIRFNPDGSKVFVCYKSNNIPKVAEFSLSTPFDLSTKSFVSSLNLGSLIGNIDASTLATPAGLDWNSDGTKLYVAGIQVDHLMSGTKRTKVVGLSGATGNLFTPVISTTMDVGTVSLSAFGGTGLSAGSPIIYEMQNALVFGEIESTGLVNSAGEIYFKINDTDANGVSFDDLGIVSYAWSITSFSDKSGNLNYPTDWVGVTSTSSIWNTLRIDIPSLGFETSENTLSVRCVVTTQAFGDTFVDANLNLIFSE